MKLSLIEKKRRYALIREEMKKEGLSALLVISNAQINQQGFVRYFTNLLIPIYSHGLLFAISGEPILLTPSPLQTFWAKELSWMPRENIQIAKAYGKDFGNLLIKLNIQDKKIGLINYQTCTAQDFKDLIHLCPRIELGDSTKLLETIRSKKSSEEIECIKRAINIAEIAHQTFYENIVPGISETELIAKVEESTRRNGGERSFYLISTNIKKFFPYVPGNSKVNKDSPLLFSVEVSGPQGYWSQIVRTYFWGKPKGTLERLYRTSLDLRLLAQEELRPRKKGKRCC